MKCGIMENKETVYEKSENFAVRIVNMCKYLMDTKNEYILSKQVLRSGTSIFANLSEAECAISKNDWLAKVYIALKECSETAGWVRLLVKTDYLEQNMYDSIYSECLEIKKILSASTKTMQEKLKK